MRAREDISIRGWLRRQSPLILAAALAAFLHMVPYLLAESATPPGWTFTGNIQNSVDLMQYRSWFRETQVTGPLIANHFTSEPNRPHLLLIYPYIIGMIAGWTGIAPEFVYAYLGSILAFVFTVLLFVIVRQFVQRTYEAWWIFLPLLLGGGISPFIKLISRFGPVHNSPLAQATLSNPDVIVLEDYRGVFALTTLIDTHFLILWTLASLTLLSLYWTLRRFSIASLALTNALYVAATLVHLYEGVTLVTITASIAMLCRHKGVASRPAIVAFLTTTSAVALTLGWHLLMLRNSGLPPPSWVGVPILPTILFIAFPLAWILVAWGLGALWRNARLEECFLLGWLLGCTLMTLSGPYYPYPSRGTLTLQIPLFILAGMAYFRRYSHVRWPAAILVVALLGVAPAWLFAKIALRDTVFNPDKTAIFVSDEHQHVNDTLVAAAGRSDLLLAPRQELLWLAPEFPGRQYCGHFFLTVNFQQKCAEVEEFFRSTPEQQAQFLREHDVRFLYVDARRRPEQFLDIPGLRLLDEKSIGSLFAVDPGRVEIPR